MSKELKKKYFEYRENIIVKSLKVIYNNIKYYLLSDKLFIKLTFRLSHGYSINLKHPKSLNEKIQWLKLYDRKPLHTQCADKYKVRDYVKEKIGEEFLIPLYLFTNNPHDINANNITHFPCIIKTNHNSSGGIIIKSKLNQNWQDHQNWLKYQLNKNYYRESREWQYKNIEKGIIVEKLLQTKDGTIPFDYKIHCFNGKPKFIQVDLNRGTPEYSRNLYSIEWNTLQFGWYAEKEGGIVKRSKGEILESPSSLQKMLFLSSKLASEFIYSRIDWYDIEGKLYFGEITFHQDSGLRPIEPLDWDYKLGNELKITL